MAASQTCVVCGASSTRPSWTNSGVMNGVPYVACDIHSLIVTHHAATSVVTAVPGIRKHPISISETSRG